MYKLKKDISMDNLVHYGFSICHYGSYIRTNNIERHIFVSAETREISSKVMVMPGYKKPLICLPKTKKYIKDLINDGLVERA